MSASVSAFFQRRFQRWLARNLPPNSELKLDRKNLFILPSAAGCGYLLAMLLVWLLGTNYQNNLALATAYLMASLFVIAIAYTFANLAGISLSARSGSAVFAGDEATVLVTLAHNGKRARDNITLGYRTGRRREVALAEVNQLEIELYFATTKRGYNRPGRLLLESSYPLGILRCWTHIDLDVAVLAYPKPVSAGSLPIDSRAQATEGALQTEGSDDFSELKPYQLGHSLKHIAWKHYAREQGLHTKHYSDYRASQLWLDWDALPGLAREARLARLTDWLLKAERTGDDYGLRLPGQTFAPGRGAAHRQRLLEALALFEIDAFERELSCAH